MKAGVSLALALLMAGAVLPLAAVGGATGPNRQPVALDLTLIPATLPAGKGTYPALVISLLDGGNLPTLSLSDVVVYLSSSNQSVARLPSAVTLPAGRTFIQVDVNTTSATGTTTFAGTSSGLSSASVDLKTVDAVGGPGALALFASPAKSVYPLMGWDSAFAVQLQTPEGKPSISSQDVKLVVTSSNSSLIKGTINVTIHAGSDLAYGRLLVNSTGTATLTALASPLAIGSATITVLPVSRSFSVTPNPSDLSVGGSAQVSVSARVLGMPVSELVVNLTSSLGVIVPPLVTTGADGNATAKYIAEQPGPATILAAGQSAELGGFNGSALIIVATQTTTAESSGPPAYWVYIPVIVVAAVAVGALLYVRRTVRKRGSGSEEEFAADTVTKP